jgi:hypothetical protein
MADVVRLAIVYDTAQAAAAVTSLNGRLDKLNQATTRSSVVFARAKDRWATSSEIMASMASSAAKAGETLQSPTRRIFSLSEAMGKIGPTASISGARLQGMARAGLTLASGLATGTLSARTLAMAMSRLAGAAVLGAVIISIITVVNALKEYKRIVQDVEDTIDRLQTGARDTKREIALMLGENVRPESNAEKAIKRLRDAAAEMRREAARLGGGAGKLLNEQADALLAEIPGIAARAAGQPARVAARALQEYNRELEKNARILFLLNAGPLEQMDAELALMKKRLNDLVEAEGPHSKAVAFQAEQINLLTARMGKLRRAATLLTGGLDAIANAIEDFVITGTLAFEDLLNNILRMLYRDFTQGIIGGIVNSVTRRSAGGVGQPGIETTGDATTGGPMGSVASNVTFNINAIDAKGVAAFIQGNGAQIAATVAGHAARARGLRKQLTRG